MNTSHDQYHIAEHPTHSKNRYARIKAEHAAKNNRPIGAVSVNATTVLGGGLLICFMK